MFGRLATFVGPSIVFGPTVLAVILLTSRPNPSGVVIDGSADSAPTPPSRVQPTRLPSPSPWPTVAPRSVVVPARPSTPTPAVDGSKIKAFLDRNFGVKGFETSWYAAVRRLSVHGNIVEVQTSLGTAPGDNEKALAICSALSGFVFDNTRRELGLSRVVVLDRDLHVRIDRDGRSGQCTTAG